MELVLMRSKTDCEVAAIANSCRATYDEAKTALNWRRLPKGTENPIFGNPWNLYRALVSLGFWKKNVTLSELLAGKAEPGKTIVLIHDPQNPTLAQHWVTWHGYTGYYHALAWGDSQMLRMVSENQFKDYFLKGWPNCAFTVYKASVWRIWWEKLKVFFGADK